MTASSQLDNILESHERETVLRLLAAAAFLIFAQAYLVAPLIPAYMKEFHASDRVVGLLVPAYLLPYGFCTLFYGPISDRIGRRPVLLSMIAAIALATLGTSLSPSLGALLALRVAAGVASGGIIPISLALLGDLFSYQQLGRAIGWIFGAIAGGMAFGSTLGALLNPIIGWRLEFAIVGILFAAVLALAYPHRALLEGRRNNHPPGIGAALRSYVVLFTSPRSRTTYSCVFVNALFHSGVFSWLGFYFSRRYGLGDRGIGLALLGYGVPGMLLGPTIGHFADRFGRNRLIPAGLLVSALSAAALAPHVPIAMAVVVVTTLSLGLDMSHPPLSGIITSLDANRRGQALGLNAFLLFTGMGSGALLFQLLLTRSLMTALTTFAAVELLLALLAAQFFRHEKRPAAAS
jgi:predicted MFS family arabinose efflux permease